MIVAAFVVSIIALIVSGVAALYTWKQYQTDERARRTADDPIFRAQWVRLRHVRDILDPTTSDYEYLDDEYPRLRIINEGSATAFDCRFGVKGNLLGASDLAPAWVGTWSISDLRGQRRFTLRWTNRDNSVGTQTLKIGAPPASAPLYDSVFGSRIR